MAEGILSVEGDWSGFIPSGFSVGNCYNNRAINIPSTAFAAWYGIGRGWVTGSCKPMSDPDFSIGLVEVAEYADSHPSWYTRGVSPAAIVVKLMSGLPPPFGGLCE